MTQLQDQMAAAIQTLQSQHGLTADQVNAIVSQANAPLLATLNAAVNSEKDDAAQIADVKAALGEFTTAFAPAAPTPSPDAAPAPAPDATPTPAPAPTPAPDAAPTAA